MVQERVALRQQEARGHVILDQTAQRRAVTRGGVLVLGAHDVVGLAARQLALREVQVDLVTVEVGVEGVAVGVVHTNGLTLRLQDARAQRHDGRLVQRRLAVDQQDVALQQVAPDALHADVARGVLRHQHLRQRLALPAVLVLQVDEEALVVLQVARAGVGVAAVDHQLAQHLHVVRRHRLGVAQLARELQRHAHLVRVDVGVRRDDGPRGEVHALAHQVGAEQALLVLQQLADAARVLVVARLRAVHQAVVRLLHVHPVVQRVLERVAHRSVLRARLVGLASLVRTSRAALHLRLHLLARAVLQQVVVVLQDLRSHVHS